MMGQEQDHDIEADQRIKEPEKQAGKQEEMVGAGNSMFSVVTGRRKGDNNEQAEEYWDPKTAAFSSPFYDPFCEGGEEEVNNNIAHLPAGVATIQAYHSNGAHRA